MVSLVISNTSLLQTQLHREHSYSTHSAFSSRVIQKALDELSNRNVANLIATFHGNARDCLDDHNGKTSLRVGYDTFSEGATDTIAS
jgi:hypothetical protein